MASALTGNFVQYVSGQGGSDLFGQGGGRLGSMGTANHDTIVLDNSLAARGGNGNGKGGGGGGSGGGTVVTDTYTSGSSSVDDSQEFNITIEFIGEWSDDLKAIFIASADYLSSVIEGDLADITYDGQLIDDIVIQASLSDIDGEGGVLGQAGPTVVRTANYLPVQGIMEFDISDAQAYYESGHFDDIVLHEMMHVLGFGTLWDNKDLVTTEVDDNGTRRPVDDTIISYYNGSNALASYGDTMLFVETDGGSGTAGGHWDEETYQLELMTGYIGYFDPNTETWSGDNYLADWSVASLADLGYELAPGASGLGDVDLIA